MLLHNVVFFFVFKLCLAGVIKDHGSGKGHGHGNIHIGNVTYGTLLYDTSGNEIQAHSGGMYREDNSNIFYLYGNDFTGATNGDPFKGVNLYASRDLEHWEFVNTLVNPESPGWSSANGGNVTGCSEFAVLERPKIYFNKHTNKYVMYSHVTDAQYDNTMVSVATSDKLESDWEFQRCYKVGGLKSWDLGLYVDDDEKQSAYLIYSSNANGKVNGALRISKLSEDGLSSEIDDVCTGPGALESPVIFKQDGIYTLIVSHTSGWSSNDNVYVQASNISDLLSGSFTQDIAEVGTNTFDSQVHYAFPLNGVNGEYSNFVYMGDRNNYPHLNTTEYCWTPINSTVVSSVQLMNCHTWSYKMGQFSVQGSWNQ